MKPTKIAITLGICFALSTASCFAAPYRPTDDNEILERLPPAVVGSAGRIRALTDRLRRDPRNLSVATEVARAHILRARREADPRFLGYAQAALTPWWQEARPPLEALLLRAIIRQGNHEFEAALTDLDRVVALAPNHPEARLVRAMLHHVRGDPARARRDCLVLARFATALVSYTCLTTVSVSADMDRSFRVLEHMLEQNRAAPLSYRQWAYGTLAEIAERRGDAYAARHYYAKAIEIAPPDVTLLSAYADFLLDQNRPLAVISLLRPHISADPLLLRLARAEKSLGWATLGERIQRLQARFEANRERGDGHHVREEAAFALYLLNRPRDALRLARLNWAQQREPTDTRLFLEATLAADDAQAARPVLDWLRRERVQDARLQRLAARYAGGS